MQTIIAVRTKKPAFKIYMNEGPPLKNCQNVDSSYLVTVANTVL